MLCKNLKMLNTDSFYIENESNRMNTFVSFAWSFTAECVAGDACLQSIIGIITIIAPMIYRNSVMVPCRHN